MPSKLIKLTIFLLALFFAGNVSNAQKSPDAIAIRVIPNSEHYSPTRWYKEQGFTGSPQIMSVDGYEAIRDGRTVYVNAANIGADNTIYTNIYLMSYNQDAEEATVEIVNEILSHWRFNANITDSGQCVDQEGNLGNGCLTDADCSVMQHCQSPKAKITRDTRRLADLAEVKIALNDYQEENGHYPKLEQGSYLPGKSLSVWPSWHETLTKEIGTGLPNDPINRLGECSGFDPSTCWSEQDKKFADPDTDDPELNLPDSSRAYVYAAKDNGASYKLCAVMESGLLTTLAQGACSGSEMTAQYNVNADNNPPAISGANLPPAAPNASYQGFIKAFDPDNDPIGWSFAVVSCPLWTNLKIKDTAVSNQKAITADNTGGVGECKITITLNDGRGGITSQNYTITQAACAATCSASGQPNCQTIAPANSILGIDVCCGLGESCYQCQAGYTWDGANCAASGPVCGNGSCEGSENCCSCAGDCVCSAGSACQSDGTCLPNLIIEMFDDTAYKDNANTTAEWTGDGEVRLSGTAANNEFQVNTWTASDQHYPSAVAFPDNSFVISWASYNQDGPGWGVYAQRFNADGTKAGTEFPVNTWTASDQYYPSAAAFSDNSFVISWMGGGGQDGSGYGIFAQRFNADGNKAGAEFPVNTWTAANQHYPSAVAFPDNSFVISWTSENQDGSFDGVYAQRFNADGSKNGAEFKVNTWTADIQYYPSVVAFPDNSFVISWASYNQDGSGYGVYAQRFNADGTKAGTEFPVNTWTAGSQYYPSAVAFSDNSFVISWASSNQDGSSDGVYAQRFNADGSKNGAEFPVNTWTVANQHYPSAVAFSDNSFVISWASSNQDGSGYGVYAQRFNADGSKNGAESPVNTWTANDQHYPSAVAFPDNSFVISWASENQDGSVYGVYAQRFNADGAPIAINTYTSPATAQSITLDNTADTITKARLTVDQEKNGQTVTHYLSANGGANWEQVDLGVEHIFTNTGSDLKWKAVLTSSDPGITPIIKGYNLSYEWDNGCGACVPNGCNANCPANCTVAQDPDCGCLNGNGCCGIGCDNANDNDCAAPPPPVCVPNGCNANCPANCTVAQDPDCGCLNGNGCCGIGCDNANDNDCAAPPPPVTYNWDTGAWSACGGFPYAGYNCGPGTQTRTVVCKDSSGAVVGDAFCAPPKPAISQNCSVTNCLIGQANCTVFWDGFGWGCGAGVTSTWVFSGAATNGPVYCNLGVMINATAPSGFAGEVIGFDCWYP